MDDAVVSTIDTYESVAEQYRERHADRAVKRGDGTASGTVYEDDDRRFVLYTPGEISERVTDAGFTIEDLTSTDGWIHCIATA